MADSKIPASETQPGFFAVTISPGPRRWLFCLLLVVILLGAGFYLDTAVRDWVTQNKTPIGTAFMRQVSRWGDWPTHIAAGLVGLGIAYVRDSRRWMIILTAMVIACAVAGSVNRIIKVTTGRARPSIKLDVGWNGPRLSSKYNSFPSGHTASSVAFFAALVLVRRRFGLAMLPIPVLIAGSRLYLNAHHLSDVAAGAIVGVSSAVLTWHFLATKWPGAVGALSRPDGK